MNKKSSIAQRTLEKLGLSGFSLRTSSQVSTNKKENHASVKEDESHPPVQALTSVELDIAEKNPKHTVRSIFFSKKAGNEEPKQKSMFYVVDNDSEMLSTPQNSGLDNAIVQEKKKKIQPEGTIAYIVQELDTLEKIAARFDTTPSELKKLNKLTSAMIFPGQTIFIPGPDYIPRKSTITSLTSNEDTLKFSQSADKNASPGDKSKCPYLDSVKTGNSVLNIVSGQADQQAPTSSVKEIVDFEMNPLHKLMEDEIQQLKNACMEKFIKINVRYITDGQGVVKGTLLVTPNAMMFDPDVLDPLVIEHGAEKYGMIAPMDMIISAAIYHDIAAMKMRGQIMEDGTEYQMPKVYHDHSCPMAKERLHSSQQQDQFSNVLPQLKHNALSSSLNRQDSVCSCGALERSDSFACDDNNCKAEDFANTVNDSRIDEFCKDCNKGGNDDAGLDKDLCVSEAAGTASEEGIKITNCGKDFSLDRNNANEVGVSKTDAKNYVDELDEDNLRNEALDNVTDTDRHKMKSNIKLGKVQKKLSVTFSFQEQEEVHSISSDMHNDIAANQKNTYQDTTKIDDAKLNIIDNDIMKNEVRMCQSSYNGMDRSLGKTENSVIGIDADTDGDLPMEKDTDDQAPVQCVEKTQATLAQLNLEKFVEISNADLENADSPDISKTDNRSIEKVRTSSTSSLGSFSPTPHLNAFVNYATGCLQKHASDSNANNNKDVISDALTTDAKPENHQLGKKQDIPMVSATPGKRRGKMSRHGDVVKRFAVESAVTMDEKLGLLTMDYNKFAPKPAVMHHDPPLYLCLRLGKRPNEMYSYHNYSIESYGRRRKQPEYWFSIPREKVDHLYAFLLQWTPEIYGDNEEITPEKRGFVVMEDGFNDDLDDSAGPNFHKDWEIMSKDALHKIISQNEALKRCSIVFEVPIPLPELIGESAIMTEQHIASLSPVMMGRIVGYPWTLIYSTDINGFSLNSLYRIMVGVDCPVLLVVLDDSDNVFGALTSCPPKISESFYGTGESFLFTFYPEFKLFAWSGENNFFMKGNKESLAIGAGQGVFGLWFDEDLYHGRTNKCETFNNDLLTSSEDFIVKGIEAWAFYWD